MKRLAAAPLLVTLLASSPAGAVALFGGGKPVMVHEDYVFLRHDESTKRMHVLFAARVAPAFRRVSMGIPTPASPTIETFVLDLPDALHQLIAPHEMRLGKRPPAPPAPWLPSGAKLDTFIEPAAAADPVFDAAWTKTYVDKGFFIAGLGVVTPEDGRVEVVSPTVHISYASERLVLARREPPLPIQDEQSQESELPDKPRQPVEVSVDKVEPSTAGITGDAILQILGKRTGGLVECYERFLERQPNTRVTLSQETTIRPKGEVVSIKSLDKASDVSTKELDACVTKVLRTTQMPTANEGYKVRVSIAFAPPRVPSRRTHVVVVGSAKYVWPNVPATVRLTEDFEVVWQDVARAFRPDVRKALGLSQDSRVWVSHWVDRDTRRALADDVVFERQDLPPVEKKEAAPRDVHHGDTTQARPGAGKQLTNGVSRKNKRAIGMLGALAVALVVGLWIARGEVRG